MNYAYKCACACMFHFYGLFPSPIFNLNQLFLGNPQQSNLKKGQRLNSLSQRFSFEFFFSLNEWRQQMRELVSPAKYLERRKELNRKRGKPKDNQDRPAMGGTITGFLPDMGDDIRKNQPIA